MEALWAGASGSKLFGPRSTGLNLAVSATPTQTFHSRQVVIFFLIILGGIHGQLPSPPVSRKPNLNSTPPDSIVLLSEFWLELSLGEGRIHCKLHGQFLWQEFGAFWLEFSCGSDSAYQTCFHNNSRHTCHCGTNVSKLRDQFHTNTLRFICACLNVISTSTR